MGATDNFRRNLVAYMESHPDYSWRALSRDSGVSKSHLLNFVAGVRRDVTLTCAELIAAAIGKSLEEMIQ